MMRVKINNLNFNTNVVLVSMQIDFVYSLLAISYFHDNYCFDSLAIRLWSKELKHLIPRTGRPELQG